MKSTSPHIRSTTIAVPKDFRSDGNGNSVKNRFLMGLPRKEWKLISPQLTLMNFNLHDLLHEEGKPIAHCYFPNTMMASVLNVMIDGESVEVGLRGWEGFVGLPLVAGFRTEPNYYPSPGNRFANRCRSDAESPSQLSPVDS